MGEKKKVVAGSFYYKNLEQREEFCRLTREKENLSVAQKIRQWIEEYVKGGV